MGFVDEEVIHAEFIEHEAIIFLVFRQQVFQSFLASGFLLLDGLDEIPLSTGAAALDAVTE